MHHFIEHFGLVKLRAVGVLKLESSAGWKRLRAGRLSATTSDEIGDACAVAWPTAPDGTGDEGSNARPTGCVGYVAGDAISPTFGNGIGIQGVEAELESPGFVPIALGVAKEAGEHVASILSL